MSLDLQPRLFVVDCFRLPGADSRLFYKGAEEQSHPGQRGEDFLDPFRVHGIVVHPFAPLDVDLSVIVNELSASL